MSYEIKPNTGTLFKNDVEGKSENFPPYGGTVNIDGTEYWVSAWVKDGSKGKYFSLAFKPKEQRQESRRQAPAVDPFADDSAIPF